MQIRFADSRPDGDYALVVAVAGKNRSALDQIGGERPAIDATLNRQRFEGDSGSAAELFVPADKGVRRVLIVGVGEGNSPVESAEKLGGTAVARLLTSGETHIVIDVTGADYDADAAARIAFAASLRGWRYDVYRTRLKDKQKPTLKKLTIVGRDRWAALPFQTAPTPTPTRLRPGPRLGASCAPPCPYCLPAGHRRRGLHVPRRR